MRPLHKDLIMKENIEKMSVNLVLQHVQIGLLIRQHRKSFKITANAAADTARILRVTLHGIERSEPSVSMDGYLNVIRALGLHLHQRKNKSDVESEINRDKLGLVSIRISLTDYPF